jgi:hypothetical protein
VFARLLIGLETTQGCRSISLLAPDVGWCTSEVGSGVPHASPGFGTSGYSSPERHMHRQPENGIDGVGAETFLGRAHLDDRWRFDGNGRKGNLVPACFSEAKLGE